MKHQRLRMLIKLWAVHTFYRNSGASRQVAQHISQELDYQFNLY